MAAKVRIRFPRLNALPDGTRFEVLTNGTLADNGDLIPNVNPAAAPTFVLTANPIEIWPTGKAGEGFGAAGLEPAGLNGNTGIGYGAGYEPAGQEEAGTYTDFMTWEARMLVRDGDYIFAVRASDRYGTVQSDPLATQSVTVAGKPRPPTNLRFVSYAAGNVNLSWARSPDL